MRMGPIQSLALACLLTLTLAPAGPAHAGGIGISEPPDSIAPTPPLGVSGTAIADKAFHLYKVPIEQNRRANRDYEFLWSHTYVDRFHTPLDSLRGTPAKNDMDRLGEIMCEEQGRNPFGLPFTEVELAYNYLAQQESFRGAFYDPDPDAAVGLRVARPDYPDSERTHLDAYIYAPYFSSFPQYPQWGSYAGDLNDPNHSNYGSSPSAFEWGSEDSLGGHNGAPLHANSLMIPGPPPWKVAHTEQEDFWRWTRPGGGANAQLSHEGLHTLNNDTNDLQNDFLHLFASAAEVVTGVAIDPGYNDVDYTASLAPIAANASNSYPHWQGFSAYLAFNFRGADTTMAGYYDDLLRRWSTKPRAERTMIGLAARLSDAECVECRTYEPFVGLDNFSRVQRLIHDWRVASYANAPDLPGGHWGYPSRFGFAPAEQLGAWKDVNPFADNAYSIPPIVNVTATERNHELRFSERPAGPGASTRPLRLNMFGAEYFVFRADPSLATTQQHLSVRVRMPGLLRGRQTWHPDSTCKTVEYSGRLFASVVTYSQASDSLYAHPEWATGVTTKSAFLDRVNPDVAFDVPGFGAATKAVVVVVTLEDGPEGAHMHGVLRPQRPPGRSEPAEVSNQYDVELVALAGQSTLSPDPVSVAATVRLEGAPAWSPRGDSLAFEVVDEFGSRRIYIAPALSAGPARQLWSGTFAQYDPTWSPRDYSIAFTRARIGGRDLWVTTASGTAQQLTNLTGYVHEPAFSPNGAQLAYLRYVRTIPPPEDTTIILPPGQQAWVSELRLLTVDNSVDIVLATFAGDSCMSNLRWTPDGRYLLMLGTGETANEPWHFWQVDVPTRQMYLRDALVLSSRAFDPHPGAGRLLVMQEGQLVWQPVIDGAYDCSTDTLTRHLPFQNLSLRDTTSGSLAALSQVGGVLDSRFRWSPDGTKVAYVQVDGGNANVLVTAATTNRAPYHNHSTTYYQAPACEPWQYLPMATDPDGDPITYEVFDLPPGAISQQNGMIVWQYPVVGHYWMIARALDSHGALASRVIHLEVVDQATCGGGGGEGDPGPGHDYDVRARQPGATRVFGGGYPGPTRVVNTLLDGAPSGEWVSQTARLLAARADSLGQVRTLLVARRPGSLRVDRARLLVADHARETVALASESGIVVGPKRRASRLTLSPGEELTSELSGAAATARLIPAGSVLAVEWAAGELVDGLLVDCARASGADSEQEWGVRIEVPDASGWVSSGLVRPRTGFDALAVPLAGTTTARLVFVSDTYVREVAGFTLGDTASVVVTPVELDATGVESGVESLAATDSISVDLTQGQQLTMLFNGPPPAADRQRTLFLDLVASFTPEGSVAPAGLRAIGSTPTRFALLGNRPNPFGSGTTIHFDVPRPAAVRFEVFDAQGRRVRTLVDGAFEPGTHTIAWDGSDGSGRRLRPGVYLYRMTADGFHDQRRMVLLGAD